MDAKDIHELLNRRDDLIQSIKDFCRGPDEVDVTRVPAAVRFIDDGDCIEVDLLRLGLTVSARARCVLKQNAWEVEYVFHHDNDDVKIEVFRFYVNEGREFVDESGAVLIKADSARNLAGSLAECVYGGVFKSGLSAPTPSVIRV